MKEYLNKLTDGTYKLVVLSGVIDGHDGLIEIPEGAESFNYFNSEGNVFFLKNNGDETLFSNETEDWAWQEWGNIDFDGVVCLWQRHTQPEELPCMDDEDKQEELEKIKIKVNGNLDAAVSKIQELGYWNCQFDKIPRDAYWILGNQDGTVDFSGVKEILNEYQEENTGAFDTQIGGNHYKSLAIQPMQYALENKLDYAQSNVVKYVTRHASKGGKEDLLKAIHNIELMIAHYYS